MYLSSFQLKQNLLTRLRNVKTLFVEPLSLSETKLIKNFVALIDINYVNIDNIDIVKSQN